MSNNNNNRQYNNNYNYGQYNDNYYLFGRDNYTSPRGNNNWRSPGNYNRDSGGTSGRGGWYGSPRLSQYQHGVRHTTNFKNNYSKKHNNKLNLSNNKSSDFKNRPQNSFGQLPSANNEKSKKNLESEPIADAVEPSNENEKERSKKVEEDVLRLQKLLLNKNASSVDIDNSLSSSGLDDENELTSEKRESCLTLPTLQLTESDYKEIGAIAGRKEHEEDDDYDGRKEDDDDDGRKEDDDDDERREEEDDDEERKEDAEVLDEKSDSYSKSDDHDNSNEMYRKDNDAFEDCSSRKSDDVILVNNPDKDMVIDISDDPPVTENVSDGQLETPCDALKESSNEGLSNLSDNDVENHSDSSGAKDVSENDNGSVGENKTNDDNQTLLNVDDTLVSAINKSVNVENDTVVSISDEIRENNKDDCMVNQDDGNNDANKATKSFDGADNENENATIGNNYLLNFKNESEKIVGYIDRDIRKDGKQNTISHENANEKVMSKQISSLYRSFLKCRRFGTSLSLKDKMLRHKDLLDDNPFLNKHNLSEFKKRIIVSTCNETNESVINEDMISESNEEISTERNETVIVEKEADEFMENYGHLLDDNFTIPVDVLKQLGLSDIANEVFNNELLNPSDDNAEVMQSDDSYQVLSPTSKEVTDSLVNKNQSSCHKSSPEKSTNYDRASTINDVDMENENDSAYIQIDTSENRTDENLCYSKNRFPESFTKDHQSVNQGDSTVSTSCDDSTLQQSIVTSMQSFLKSKCNSRVQPTKLNKKENSLRAIEDVKVADYFNCVVESALKTADAEVSSDPAILIVQAVVGSVLNICDVDNKVQNRIVSFLDSLNNDSSNSLTKTKQSSDFKVSERDSDLTSSSNRGIEPSFASIPDLATSDNLVKQIVSFGKDKYYKKSTQVVSTASQNQSESSVICEPDKNSEQTNLIAGSSSSNIPKQNEIQAYDTDVHNKKTSLVPSERETQSRSLKLRNEVRTSEIVDSSGESTAESSLDGLQNLLNLLITIDKQVASLTQQKMDVYNEIQNNFDLFRKSGINSVSNSLLNDNEKSVKVHSSNLLSVLSEGGESDSRNSVDSDCALSDIKSRRGRKKLRVKNNKVHSKSPSVTKVSQTRSSEGRFQKQVQVVQQEPTKVKRELRSRSLSTCGNTSKRSSIVNNDDSVKRRKSSRLNLNDNLPSIQESENSEINLSSVHIMDEDSDCTSITSSPFKSRNKSLQKKSLINTKIKHCFVDLSTSNPIKDSSTLRNIENEPEDIKPSVVSRSTRSNSVSREETNVKRSARNSSVNNDEANEPQINDLLSVQPIDFNLDNSLRVTAVKENQGFLFFGFDDGRIFKMKSEGTLLDHVYSGHEGSVNCLEVYSNILITGSSDCTVIMHRLTGDREWIAALPVEEPVQCLFVRWNTLYVGTKNGKIARYSCVRKVEIGTKVVVGGENDHVLAIHATKEGPRKILIVAAKSLPLTIRDANTGLLLRSVSCNDVFYSLAFFSSTPFVYCGTRFHSVAIIDFTTGEKTGELQLGNNVIKVLIKWNLLFTASYNGYIHIYNIENEELLGRFSVGSVITEMEIWNNKIILTTTQSPMVLNFPEVLKSYLSKNNLTC